MDVLVLATMSAGKSTFINALIGTELLHSANEATTACLTSVRHNADIDHFYGSSYGHDNETLAFQNRIQAEAIRNWNSDPNVGRIYLTGPFRMNESSKRSLVLHDTPGPNNSQDSRHAGQMLNAIQTLDFDVICYVLNTTQLGTNDDRDFLAQLQSELQARGKKHTPIYFILNKVDQLDDEKGEHIIDYVNEARSYLENLGFNKPIVIPTVATLSLFASKAIYKEKLTRAQRHTLQQALDHVDDMEFAFVYSDFLPDSLQIKLIKSLWELSNKQRQNVLSDEEHERINLQRIITLSGIKTVELLINSFHKPTPKKITQNPDPIIIEITHNPFTVETSFFLNGQEPPESCKLWGYKESRLQTWVEKLFDELDELFNGDNHYRIIFTGVESDYLDIFEAVEAAITNGMYVETEWVPVKSAEDRFTEIKALLDTVCHDPDFSQIINNNNELKANIEEALNYDFDVSVIGTMSSGKSTLINAMLGSDLLPVSNEATTATITRITDHDDMPDGVFNAERYDSRGNLVVVDIEKNVTADTLREWNLLPDTQLIDIKGNIQVFDERESARVVLTDTLGPNNSQDEEHQRTTMGFIQDSRRNPLILYVLNSTQLGTDDDRNLLTLIAEIMDKGGKQSKDRFIFVVNKMDEFDPESGESIESALVNVRNYLEKNGISNPQIYPISANFTLLIRKPSDSHNRRERGEYKLLADLFEEEPSMNMLQYMPLTARVQRNLKNKNYSKLILSSGVPAVEVMVDEYVDKYILPLRLKYIYDLLINIIDKESQKIYLKIKNFTDNSDTNLKKFTSLLDLKKEIEIIFSL